MHMTPSLGQRVMSDTRPMAAPAHPAAAICEGDVCVAPTAIHPVAFHTEAHLSPLQQALVFVLVQWPTATVSRADYPTGHRMRATAFFR